MANMTLISTQTIGAGGAASIDFTVPSGFTDLMIVASLREATTTNQTAGIRFNNDSSAIYTSRRLQGNGTTAISQTYASGTEIDIIINGSDMTANTFGSLQMYIPNYLAAVNKSVSIESLSENNATLAYSRATAGSWASTAAITAIKIFGSVGNLAQYSTASLYGINKWAQPTAKATGGTIVYGLDGYTYHTFTSSGTFTPTSSVTADVMVIAGGGGGGLQGGGGGAGGFQVFTSQAISSAQTVTIGAGGAANSNGGNSSFGALTASIGGGTGSYGFTGGAAVAGASGGSGGGGGGAAGGNASAGGTGTAGQGYAGGSGTSFTNYAGGGGGATSVGGNASGGSSGAGGSGNSSYSAWASATGTGVSGAYAGGGGGSGGASGGSGGGGAGGGGNGVAGSTNTGSGGGGAYTAQTGGTPAAGGSGIVIVRYAS